MSEEWTAKAKNDIGMAREWRVSRWTEEEDSVMRSLAAEGATGAMIALKLRRTRTRSAVMGRFYRLGIKLGDVNGFNTNHRPMGVGVSPKRKRAHILFFKKPGEELTLKKEYRPVPIPFRDTKPVAEIDPNCKCNLHDLTDNACRWPLWNDRSIEKFYCGTPTNGRSSYCLGHSLIATTTRGYAVYSRREPLPSLVTKTLPANSPKSKVA